MRKYVKFQLADPPMDLIVDHLVAKYGLTESRAAYGNDGTTLEDLLADQVPESPFQLYIVGHGSDIEALISNQGGEDTPWRYGLPEFKKPHDIAAALFRAIPDRCRVRVKLGMCFGGTPLPAAVTEKVQGGFAPSTVTADRKPQRRIVNQFGMETREFFPGSRTEVTFVERDGDVFVSERRGPPQIRTTFANAVAQSLKTIMAHANNPKNLSEVFIGGFDAAVYWDQRGLHKNAPRAKEGATYTRIKRKYYAPSSGGEQVSRIRLPTAKSPTFCYFPVKLVQDAKLRNR